MTLPQNEIQEPMRLFLLHNPQFFRTDVVPAIAACFRSRSFDAFSQLNMLVASRIDRLAERALLIPNERPLFSECPNLPFHRRTWRHLAGELLLYAADEIPDFPVEPDLLSQFLPPDLVQRIHDGSRELTFDGIPYRPDNSGFHDVEDVADIASQLKSFDCSHWPAQRLAHVPAEDRDDELAFARQCFTHMQSMFELAMANDHLIVCEEV
jgi:hypothetical protein